MIGSNQQRITHIKDDLLSKNYRTGSPLLI